MSRQRIGRPTARRCYHNDLRKAIGTYLPRRGLPLIRDDARVRWTDRLLVTAALLTVWQAATTLRDAFAAAREVVVAMYPSRRRPGRSFEGFVQALQKASQRLRATLVPALRLSVEQLAGRWWRQVAGFVVLAVDGTRVNCPRTRANERAFGCAGKTKTAPQQLLTTLFHPGTGLLWDWRLGRGDAAERTHLRSMIGQLPRRTLLLADAGFTGYDLLQELTRAGHSFIVRVGRHVHLLKKLGYAVQEHRGIVYLWPQAARTRPPLVCRLVTVRDGCKSVSLLTNVRDATVLSNRQVGRLYRLRWGIEVQYRSLKQTMSNRTMLSGTPANARIELDWALLGLWMLGLMTTAQLARRRRSVPLSRWSVAKSLRVVRHAMRRHHAPLPAGGLPGQLRRSVHDSYRRTRPKQARAWPHKKTESPPGQPNIRTATPKEIATARRIRA